MTSLTLRPAQVADAEAAAAVLVASITELCEADHRSDPAEIAAWTANKTPETVTKMIAKGGMVLAIRAGQVVGVAQADLSAAVVTLLYVAPQARATGVSTALLSRLEADLAAAGHTRAELETTETARAFYLAHGWSGAEGAETLIKRLDPDAR